MSKIKKISVFNLKAISSLTADFNGCTAIITGGNNKGKTTFLRTTIDRIRGTKPEIILKVDEKEGFAEIDLTTGEKFRWNFDAKTKAGEKLTFISKDNIKSSLSREIANRYFPATFDVDRFLIAQPKQQKKILQELVGIDFSDIDKRYDEAYEKRTSLNRIAHEEKIKFEAAEVPEKVQRVSVDELLVQKESIRTNLNNKYTENKASNDSARKAWQQECDNHRKEIDEFNKVQSERTKCSDFAINAHNQLISLGYDGKEVGEFVGKLKGLVEAHKIYQPIVEPEYITELPDDAELKAIDLNINTANETNRKAQVYEDWLSMKDKRVATEKAAGEADQKVQSIETERMDLIKSAKMPEGFSFDSEGILYNNLPFTREQLSSSGIYIAALKLAAMTLGEVKTLHFDASFLDKNSLLDIEKWANENSYQLLIERPDFEGGEIEYQLLNEAV